MQQLREEHRQALLKLQQEHATELEAARVEERQRSDAQLTSMKAWAAIERRQLSRQSMQCKDAACSCGERSTARSRCEACPDLEEEAFSPFAQGARGK